LTRKEGCPCNLLIYNLCHVPSNATPNRIRTKQRPSLVFVVERPVPGSLTMSTPSSSTPQPTSSQQPQSAAATPQFVAYPLAPGQQPQLPPQASGSDEGRSQPQTRLPSVETRKDRSLVDFLLMLDDYEPLVRVFRTPLKNALPIAQWHVKIPDEVTDYYLQRVGFDCQDARL
jgi:hypothetical protein